MPTRSLPARLARSLLQSRRPLLPQTRRNASSFFDHNTRSPQASVLPSSLLNSPHKSRQNLIADPSRYYKSLLKDPKPNKEDVAKILEKGPIEDRMHTRCTVGSFVEVEAHDGPLCGLVCHPQSQLFHDATISIITPEAHTVEVNITDVTFHISHVIAEERLEEVINSPACAAKFLHDFTSVSESVRKSIRHLIPAVRAWYTKPSTSVDIDLLRISEMIQEQSKRFKTFPDECLLWAIHMHLRNHPLEWRVRRNFTTSLKSMISDSVPVTTYTANSITLAQNLEHVFNKAPEELYSFRFQLDLLRTGKKDCLLAKYRDSGQKDNDQNIGEISMIVDFLKYFCQYPDQRLVPTIKQILPDHETLTTAAVSEILSSLKSTSPMFVSELQLPHTAPLKLIDHFKHIRFTNSLPAYVLPSEFLQRIGLSENGDIAISLDKTTSPDLYYFNIHFPDVASFLPQHIPSIINPLLSRISDIDLSDDIRTLFPQENIEHLSFSPSHENRCMTISIAYPHKLDSPWTKTESTIRLERLVNLKFVPLSDLNELWRSKFPVLTDLFNFFMPSDAYEILNASDRATLMSMLSMIDYWFLKRGNEYSREYQFGRNMFADADREDKLGFLKYITQEVKLIAAEHAVKFQQQRQLPMLIKSQSILSGMDDSLHVTSNSMVIPDYQASKYEELTFFKNSVGVTPIVNYVGASYFLAPEKTSTTPRRYACLGLPLGLVNITDGLHDFESILNQWQVIAYLQSQFVSSQNDYKMGLKTLFMKGFKMKTGEELLEYYLFHVKPMQDGNRWVQTLSHRHAVLELLKAKQESHPKMNWNIFKCVILRECTSDDLAMAYCIDLDTIVLVDLNPSQLSSVKVGDQIICSKIAEITHTDIILEA
ncbi:CYFA0S04e06040g1_1 [Cyberlindnera fabianii]|uniref:CYFA0S04e06040g1_1 n=1 Tax=Cyberlindnera fabianii TaxID=36022 RepID=A0A061ARL8_CYBFA|nr:CYFA0S04e06040g1_1 [Cyberlindnera fabianii]